MKWSGMPPTAPERVADRLNVEMKIIKIHIFIVLCFLGTLSKSKFIFLVIISCHLNLLPILSIALKILDLV